MTKNKSTGLFPGLLAGGFLILLAMMFLVEIGAIRVVDSIAESNKNLYKHPFTVSNNVLEVNVHIISMHRYMKDVALAQNTEELELAISQVAKEEADAFEHFDIILERFLGDKARIEMVRQMFTDWKPIRTEVIELTRLGKNDEAALITKGKGARYVARLTVEMDSLVEFANNKADEFASQSIERQDKGKKFLYGVMAIVLVIGFTISYFVTERIEKDSKKLRESEERLGAAFADAAIGMALVSLEHRIMEVNQSYSNILGYSKDELVGVLLKDITHPDDVSASLEHHQELVAGKVNNYHFEKRYLHKQGHVVWASLSVSLIRDKDTNPLYIIAQIQDITEQKQAEEELHQYAHIASTSTDMMAFLNNKYVYIAANTAYQQAFNLTPEQLIGHTVSEVFGEEFFNTVIKPHANHCLAGEEVNYQASFNLPAYGERYMDINYYPYADNNNKIQGFVVNARDITEKSRQEVALREAQKMEAVGQLTGGIAHDFNNLLSVISGNLRFLKEDIGETSQDIDELFEDAESAVDDGAELTHRLLSFSRTQSLRPETMNVKDIIEKSVRFMSRTLADNTELATVLPDENLYIKVDPLQLDAALLDLCLNARDAMPEGGTITISAERSHEIDGDSSLSEGNYIIISVSDTGAGISPEDMQHVYEPFFTTKEISEGSGLGLSMVFGFTQQSKGSCHIESTLGEGTTVSMYFPEVIERREMEQGAEDEERRSSHIDKVILVVEDEPRVRRVAIRDLKRLGYQTLEAENADMAKSIIESGEPIDLLFSDILMPGDMNGHMLAVWTEENYPEIKIVLTSGYTKDKADVREDKAHPFPLLKKPYSIEILAEQIRVMFDERS